MTAHLNKLRHRGPKNGNMIETEDIMNETKAIMHAMPIFMIGAEENGDLDDLTEEIDNEETDVKSNLVAASVQQTNAVKFMNSLYGMSANGAESDDEDL